MLAPTDMAPLPLTLAHFRPALLDAMRGYDRARFVGDLGAGFTVAVVALPLAMAFAIASGLPPQAGIFTSIVAGFLIAALGGSRIQIGGPAGAFIVIVYGIVHQYGVANLLIATLLSGVLLFLMGLFRLGTLVRFIPVSVITGFTNGIAVLIGLSQIKDLLGLSIPNMPADFFGILRAIVAHAPETNPWAVLLALGTIAVIALWQYGVPSLGPTLPLAKKLNVVPGAIVALTLATALVALFELPVETIGTRFGGIPASLPAPVLPSLDWATARFMLVPAVTLALLGAIESLLCARVADGITGHRHDPNQELMAQGIANFVAPLLSGMPATGTIARTVTNVKSGATSPIAGIVHALALLVVILVAAPLASSIPLACLSGILLHVAWNMGEWRAFRHLRQYRLPYRVTLLSVFLLTVLFDLTVAVEFGLLAACGFFIYRVSGLSRAERVELPELAPHAREIALYQLSSVLFFGSSPIVEELRAKLPARVLVLDLAGVIYMDSTGEHALRELASACRERGIHLVVSRLAGQPLDLARRTKLLPLLGEPTPDRALAVSAGLALLELPPEPAREVAAPAEGSGGEAPAEPAPDDEASRELEA